MSWKEAVDKADRAAKKIEGMSDGALAREQLDFSSMIFRLMERISFALGDQDWNKFGNLVENLEMVLIPYHDGEYKREYEAVEKGFGSISDGFGRIKPPKPPEGEFFVDVSDVQEYHQDRARYRVERAGMESRWVGLLKKWYRLLIELMDRKGLLTEKMRMGRE